MGLRTFKKGETVKIVTGSGGEFKANIEKFVLNNSHVYVTGSFTMWHLKTQVKKLRHV
jgi:transcription antitermination factor NusG